MRFWFHVMAISCLWSGLGASSVLAEIAPQVPDPAAVQWVRENAHVLKSVEAGHSFEDLEFLREMVGEARIVSLGECTHGSREVFQMKHRLLEYLATEMGFTIFSIEANAPEAYRLNEYVLGGEGDAAELIGGMYFWTWNTEEVLAMVEWMRAFNASGRGPLQFTGFDMQAPGVAAANVVAFLQEVDPDRAQEVQSLYDSLKQVQAPEAFGLATYSFPIEAARGKTITYRGQIKTEGVDEGYAGLWWRVGGPDNAILGFDNMQEREIRGTGDWEEHVISMEVPEEATDIVFGALLPGTGKAWFDGLVVELDGQPYSDPDRFDFDYEGPTLKGYHRNDAIYHASLDTENAASGEQSLLLECVGPRQGEGMLPAKAVEVAGKVLADLQGRRDELLTLKAADQVDWMLFNARVVDQSYRIQAMPQFNYRDLAMAQNVQWIQEQNPGAKMVLWAHNGHVHRDAGWMGRYLAEAFGADYLPIGFCTARGQYYAMDRGSSNKVHSLVEPPSGSIEEILDAHGAESLMLDLRPAVAGSAASGWLREPKPMRSIGAMAMEDQFYPCTAARQYDALIFIGSTSEARQLATPTARSQ